MCASSAAALAFRLAATGRITTSGANPAQASQFATVRHAQRGHQMRLENISIRIRQAMAFAVVLARVS
jgi:hypothetical protein